MNPEVLGRAEEAIVELIQEIGKTDADQEAYSRVTDQIILSLLTELGRLPDSKRPTLPWVPHLDRIIERLLPGGFEICRSEKRIDQEVIELLHEIEKFRCQTASTILGWKGTIVETGIPSIRWESGVDPVPKGESEEEYSTIKYSPMEDLRDGNKGALSPSLFKVAETSIDLPQLPVGKDVEIKMWWTACLALLNFRCEQEGSKLTANHRKSRRDAVKSLLKSGWTTRSSG
jgi:hypothetical protein